MKFILNAIFVPHTRWLEFQLGMDLELLEATTLLTDQATSQYLSRVSSVEIFIYFMY